MHPVELEPAPDGNLLYADINDGHIACVTYGLPTAAATAAPTSGVAPLAVELDGTTSTGSGVAYAWDLDGDGQFDDGTGAHLAHSFAAGTYTVRLRVTDDCGVSAVSEPLTITRERDAGRAGSWSRAVLTGAHVNARLIHRRRPIVERPDGTVALRVHCPSPTTCAGTVAIRALTGGPILGRARFRVAARHTVTVRVRLTAPARRRSHSPSPAARDLHPVAGARTRDQLAHRHGLHAARPGTAALRATVAEDTLAGRRSLVDPPGTGRAWLSPSLAA